MKDVWATKSLAQSVDCQDCFATMWRFRKANFQYSSAACRVHSSFFNTANSFFDAVRHRRFARLGTEAIDYALQTLDLFALLSCFLCLTSLVCFTRNQILRVGAAIFDDRAFRVFVGTIKMKHACNRFVKQLEVVTDNKQRTFVSAQKVEHPRFCINI